MAQLISTQGLFRRGYHLMLLRCDGSAQKGGDSLRTLVPFLL